LSNQELHRIDYIVYNYFKKTTMLPTVSRAAALTSKKFIQEAHPFFINSTATKAAPVSIRFYTKRLARTASAYVPVYFGFFAWPFIAQWTITAAGGP